VLLDEFPVVVPLSDGGWRARVLAGGTRGSSIDVLGVESVDGLAIATHRKTGWRYYPSGYPQAADLNLEDTARHAVNALLDTERPAATDAERQRRGAEMVEESGRLAALLYDGSVWPTRPVIVDGESFALFVTTTANGQAAVADLGPVRLVVVGRSIPDALSLRTLALSDVPLEGEEE
jgi:hypothetical protein